MKKLVLFACLLLFVEASGGAQATRVFERYEGPPIIQTGSGGTKLERDGIEYWTKGTPHRTYLLIGVIKDTRPNNVLNPDALGSKGTSKYVRRLGGDAVIVSRKDVLDGGERLVTTKYGNTTTTQVIRDEFIVTEMIVIKYINDEKSGLRLN